MVQIASHSMLHRHLASEEQRVWLHSVTRDRVGRTPTLLLSSLYLHVNSDLVHYDSH